MEVRPLLGGGDRGQKGKVRQRSPHEGGREPSEIFLAREGGNGGGAALTVNGHINGHRVVDGGYNLLSELQC